MAAQDNLNKTQFYHGTPGHIRGGKVNPTMPALDGPENGPNMAFASTDIEDARSYARSETGEGTLYRVKPVYYTKDTSTPNAIKSPVPMRVIGRGQHVASDYQW